MSNKLKIGLSVVIALLALVVVRDNFGSKIAGAINCNSQTCYTSLGVSGATEVDGTLQVGTAGSALAGIVKGNCFILADASVAATTTKNFDCAASGVVAGDTIAVTETASSTLASQYVIRGAVASTTNGFITFSVLNLTGAAAVPAATNGFGSSTQFIILR